MLFLDPKQQRLVTNYTRIQKQMELSRLFRSYRWKTHCNPTTTRHRINFFFFIISIILLAMVDTSYTFIYVGAVGIAGDAGVFADSALKKALATNALDLPEAVELKAISFPDGHSGVIIPWWA